MEAACPLLRFVNYDEPKTKREIYKSHFKAKIQRFLSDKVIFILKRSILDHFRPKIQPFLSKKIIFISTRSISDHKRPEIQHFWSNKVVFNSKLSIQVIFLSKILFSQLVNSVVFLNYIGAKNSFPVKNTDFLLLRSNRNSERRILQGHKTAFTENLIFKTFYFKNFWKNSKIVFQM